MYKSRSAYVVLLVIALLQSIYFYPQLPKTINSHYTAEGIADSWSTKGTFFMVYGLIVGLMLMIFILVPRFLHTLPNALVNLPNKDYWLAPERRNQTLAVFARQMRWFGVAVIALLVIVFQIIISANLPGSSGFPTMVAILVIGGFCCFTIAWIVRMVMAWRIPPA